MTPEERAQLHREILEPLLVVLHTSAEETEIVVRRLTDEQAAVRALAVTMRAEIEAMKARGVAWDNSMQAGSVALSEVANAAKRTADESKAEARMMVEAALAPVMPALADLKKEVHAIKTDVADMRKGIDDAVIGALESHVARIEDAADKLTSAPRVKTALVLGGTFAGSAAVAIGLEIIRFLK